MKQAFVKLHTSVFLASFTGIFGRLITLSEGMLVWYRLLITVTIFFVLTKSMGRFKRLPFRESVEISKAGFILVIQWLMFYGSIKASNVSVGVICFALVGFFTAIFEPIMTKSRFSVKEIGYSFLAIVGIAVIFNLDIHFRTGIILGVLSAALAAVFTILNRGLIQKHSPSTVFLYELGTGFIILTAMLPLYFHLTGTSFVAPGAQNLVYLVMFSIFCTMIMFLLQIQALEYITAFTVNLSFNLEPLYTMVWAAIIFGEAQGLSAAFYTGLSLIVLSVVLQTVSMYLSKKKVAAI